MIFRGKYGSLENMYSKIWVLLFDLVAGHYFVYTSYKVSTFKKYERIVNIHETLRSVNEI